MAQYERNIRVMEANLATLTENVAVMVNKVSNTAQTEESKKRRDDWSSGGNRAKKQKTDSAPTSRFKEVYVLTLCFTQY